MKKFFLKGAIYLLITTIAINLIIGYYYLRKPSSFLFSSNSTSFNLKAGFVNEHLSKFRETKVFVLGSSLALNNVNAKMIEDSLGLQTMNLSSWSLKLFHYSKFNIWDHRIIIYNLQFQDFADPEIKIKPGNYPEIGLVREWLNIMFDFRTYLSQIPEAKIYLSDSSNSSYNSCVFDSNGSVLFNAINFNIDSIRWKEDPYYTKRINEQMIFRFVDQLQAVLKDHKNCKKLIFTFSPGRKSYLTSDKSVFVRKLDSLLREKCPAISFINKHEDQYPDECFVDANHFNKRGADRFTAEIIHQIRQLH